MKGKLILTTSIIVSILIIGILILGNKLDNLNKTVEAMKSGEAIERHLEEKITSIENKVNDLEIEMCDQNAENFIRSTILELNRMEDLLNKIDGLETVFGIITGLDKSSEIILDVELADTHENTQIKLAENCTVYVVGQFTRVPIDIEEFIKMVEQDLRNDFQQGFTFKIVNRKAVQIYQGWGDLS